MTICSLTTIAAFAALIPASHRGISSLGWGMTLGVAFILLATLIVLPALFELLGPRLEHAHPNPASADDDADPTAASAPPERQPGVAAAPQAAARASGALDLN